MAQLQQSIIRNRLLASLSLGRLFAGAAASGGDVVRGAPPPVQSRSKDRACDLPRIRGCLGRRRHGGRTIRGRNGRIGGSGRCPHRSRRGPFPHTCLVQATGEAFRIGAGELQAAMDHSTTLRAMLLRFVHTFIVQVSQTAYANTRTNS